MPKRFRSSPGRRAAPASAGPSSHAVSLYATSGCKIHTAVARGTLGFQKGRQRRATAPGLIPRLVKSAGGLLVLGVGLAGSWVPAVDAQDQSDSELRAVAPATPEAPPTPSPSLRGYAVTGGAAPGYVEDRACAGCHREIYQSYQEVGMARSFSRPRPENVIEDFDDNHFFHPPSRRHYEMIHRDGRYFFKRGRNWQADCCALLAPGMSSL